MFQKKIGYWALGILASLTAMLSLSSETGAMDLLYRPQSVLVYRQQAQVLAQIYQELQMQSQTRVRVNIRPDDLPEGTKISLYDKEEKLQTFSLTQAVATAPLVPGRYAIRTQDGKETSFTLLENGAIDTVTGYGWSDGEQLWLTQEPSGEPGSSETGSPAEERTGPVSPGAVTGGIGEVVPHSVRKDTVSVG